MVRRSLEFFLLFWMAGLYWAVSRLWWVRHVRFPEAYALRGPILYAHWHGDELMLIGPYAHTRMTVMTSHSRDGERQARLLKWLGFEIVRGSSSRGGAAGLKGLIDSVEKKGNHASVAVDGPRGPIYRVKPGILKLAQATGCPIVPGAAAAERRYVFKKAWNQCYVPYPFSRCVIAYGEPIWVPKNLSESELEEVRLRLERNLISLKVEAEAQYSREFSPGFANDKGARLIPESV